MRPLVSVVVPVYNCAVYVRQTIESILTQSFTDFELIVIDDGSRDSSAEIIEQIRDPRMRVLRQANVGVAATLNRGLALAQGKYIARQDHDDLSLPTRFEKQVAYMEANPQCALLGTRAGILVCDRPTTRALAPPVKDASLRFELLYVSPFVNSSVMLRKSAVDSEGGYSVDPTRQPPEDYELWSRLARRHQVANLAERLVIYRELPTSVSRTTSFINQTTVISAENIAFAVGALTPSREMWDIAALLNNSTRYLSDHPNFRGMIAVIVEAAKRIDATSPGSDVFKRAFKYKLRLGSRLLTNQHKWLRSALEIVRGVRSGLRN